MENYLEQIEELEKQISVLKEKRKKLIKKIKNTNKSKFNPKEILKSGDVIIFNGSGLYIGIVDYPKTIHNGINYMITPKISFHHEHVRLATKEEIELLGNRKYLKI